MRNIVISNNQIQEICKRIGKEISDEIKNEELVPVIVGVLKGAIPFMVDVVKNIDKEVYLDFIQVKSYQGTSSSGNVQLIKDTSFNCEGRTVIIIEDIVDTGRSMDFLIRHIKSHNAKRVLVCTLIDKKPFRINEVNCDFVGLELEGNDFLIGYGLDYNEIGRNLPYIFAATKADIEEIDKKIK